MLSLPPALKTPLIDRDHSTLNFNERVLSWARRADVPLLERLRYLCIVSSNLDEFFEVRMALHLRALQDHHRQAGFSRETYQTISKQAQELVQSQYEVYNDDLIPALAKAGIRIVSHADRNEAQHRWVKRYFDQEVKPLLTPVGLDPAHPFPQVANKSLNFIVRLSGADAFGRHNEIAIVKVPRVLPRLIRMPDRVSGGETLVVSLSSMIRAHLKDLFPGRRVGDFSQFRLTRDSELSVDEEDASNLRKALRQGLAQRHYGRAVRLEVSSGCDEYLSNFLLKQFNLPTAALFRVHGPVNLVRLSQLIDLVNQPALLFPPYRAAYPTQLVKGQSIFERLQQGDVLMHHPFESFDGVLDFLREAVQDPKVLAIKQTIYRTGVNSEVMDLLREGVLRGKEVTVIVELKARFDEEANIGSAEQLEAVGAQVVYGVVGLKTHAKMLLVTRREGRRLRRYVHLSTGNYNSRTAKAYTDLGYMTCDADITREVDQLFMHVASQNRLPPLRHLWVAPFKLHDRFLEAIERVGKAAQAGQPARIVAKMNSLTDERLVQALMTAGQQGAQIDLIVRGSCILPARVPGLTDRIRVRSIIGRMLEHTRVFLFQAGSHTELYLSSADWMNRNMVRRIEIAWPVKDASLRDRIMAECLGNYLADTQDAWVLQPDGRYKSVAIAPTGKAGGKRGVSAQSTLMKLYAAP
ncbi:MAG: polyphosphate kinase 1 [Limnohabitans sp.]